MIHQTTEYSLFKYNKVPEEDKVAQVMEALKVENYLPKKPILVTQEMIVIDGVTRLEAAKRLGVPISYKTEERGLFKEGRLKVFEDIENDIQERRSGLFTFTLRIDKGFITDYVVTEYIDVNKDYAGLTQEVAKKLTVLYGGRQGD